MPVQLELGHGDGYTESELIDLGQITTLYDFAEHDIELVVASPMQLRYPGQLAIYSCQLQDTMENLSIGHFFSRILSSPVPEATQDKYLRALCGDGDSYGTNFTDREGNLRTARFTFLSEEAASELS